MEEKYRFRFGYPKKHSDDDFSFDIERRFNHFYILGTTGTGKTSLMERMAYFDILEGRSTIFIDIKGVHAKRLYTLSPDKEKVKFISANHPASFNPFIKNYPMSVIVDEFIQILDILVSSSSSNLETTVRMKEYIIGSLPYICAYEKNPNISHLYQFLSNKSYRDKIVLKIRDADIRQCWINYDRKDSYNLRETGESICNRIAMFLFSEDFKHFLLDGNDFDVQSFVDNGKSLLVDLSGFSDYKRVFLTNLIVFSVYSYVSKGVHNNPLFLFVDEFQSCVSPSFQWLLERARSAKVGFTLAHQAFSSITNQNLMRSIVSIPDNKVVFRCGHYEAEVFSHILNTSYDSIANMDNYAAFIRMGNKTVFYEIIKKPIPVETLTIPPSIVLDKSINFISDEWIAII
jgi:hypothetical protein